MIDKACDEHPDIGDSWPVSSGETNGGYTLTFQWEKKQGECKFKCHDILDLFLESNCEYSMLSLALG
jgi:hypothetical protein